MLCFPALSSPTVSRHEPGLLAAVAALCAAPAAADVWVNGGANEVAGTQDYNGLNAYGELGVGNFSIKPMFNSYHNDLSSGAFNTYSLRLGYDTKLFGLGLTGGTTPSVNGYNNKFAGADATLSITPGGEGARQRINGRQQASGPAQGAGLARIDLGAAATYTRHADYFGSAGQNLGAAPARLSQTDLTGSAGLSILESLLSVDVTKSFYDHRPGVVDIRAPRVQNVVGLSNTIQGTPDTSVNLKVLFGIMPFVKPYVAYAHTTFQQGVPASGAYTAGVTAELLMLEVAGAYERYVQQGQVDRNYVSLTGNIRF